MHKRSQGNSPSTCTPQIISTIADITAGAVCQRSRRKSDDGLSKNWGGERVFCNPPYGRAIADWVKKCSQEAEKPNTLVVLLIPARTDTSFFHDFIYHQAEIRFLRGRLKFGNSKNSAPFPSMLAIFDNRN